MKTLLLCFALFVAQDREIFTDEGQYVKGSLDYCGINFRFESERLMWHTTETRIFLDGREVRRWELPNNVRVTVKYDNSLQIITIHARTR